MEQYQSYIGYAQNVIEKVNTRLENIDNDTFFYIIFINHAFLISNSIFRTFKKLQSEKLVKDIPFLTGFLFTLITGLGGSLIISLLTARPMIFLELDVIFLIFFISWFLVAYFPFQIIHFLTGNPLIEV
jgi:hypothetical protein